MNKFAFIGIAAIAMNVFAEPISAAEISVDAVFSETEVSLIRSYYRDHDNNEKHKGKKRERLPPGIAKNLRRGKPLPPGIAKRALPTGLVTMLPPVRDGFERIELYGKVLLVETATQVIHDILEDVILGSE